MQQFWIVITIDIEENILYRAVISAFNLPWEIILLHVSRHDKIVWKVTNTNL